MQTSSFSPSSGSTDSMKKIICSITLGVLFSASMAFAQPVPGKKGWISLFDGKTLTGWHQFNRTGDAKNWKIEDGALVCMGFSGPSGTADLVSDREFEDFDLKWDWKVAKGSNSGVFYHVLEGPKYNRPSETAPEYQLIDDLGYPAKLEELQKTGADYGMYPPKSNKIVKPADEWNSSRIKFKNGRATYWLNGKKVAAFKTLTPEWNEKRDLVRKKTFPDYGIAKKGLIGLQNHKSKAYFRNIMIREL